MTRAEFKTFALLLTALSADADTFPRFIDDVFNERAFASNPQMVKAAIVALTSGTATYNFESDMLRLLAAFFNDERLSLSANDDLNALSTIWPAASGSPKAITQDEITARDYTLYPNPDINSDPLIPLHGEPYGEDYPANNLILIYAENRTGEFADIYSIPYALEALSREFAYPSDHTDTTYAEICKTLADFFTLLIEVK